MIVDSSVTERRDAFALLRFWPVALAALLLLWMAVVAGRGVLLAVRSLGDLLANPQLAVYATPVNVIAVLVTFLSCLVAALASRRLRPAATLPVTFAMGSLIVLVCAISTGSLGSLIVALGLMTLAWLVGDALMTRLSSPAAQIVRLPIAISLGLGVLGLVLFGLATFTLLSAVTVAGTTAVLLILILTVDHERLVNEIGRLRTWRPAAPSWFETVVMGLTVGLVAYALVAAFVPETMSDAIRQHLPIAREIWQTGSAAQFPSMGASRYPMQGHVLNAVGYGIGGMTAAKLIQSLVGLTAIIGVAGLGWFVAGRLAAVVGAAIFATMPLVLWNLGHAHPDLSAVLYTVTATSCILLWQRDGVLWWLIGAGALAGFGFATKLNMALLVVALAVALFLTGRQPWQWWARISAVVAFGLGSVVVVPWLVRSYALLGFLPGVPAPLLGLLRRIFPGLPAPAVRQDLGYVAGDGADSVLVDRLSLDVIAVPWQWPFHAGPSRWLVFPNGELGIALLMLLPLAFLAPRTRATALLGVITVVSYLGWWFTLQNPRHLLPTLAIAAALAGIGVASAIATRAPGPRAALATAAQIGVVAGLVIVPVFFVPNPATQVPLGLVTGRMSAAAYIESVIPAAKVLTAASDALPADTSVAYIGQWEGAQLYTEVRLWPLGTYAVGDQNLLDNRLGTTPEAVLSMLFGIGHIEHVIWDRPATRPEDWRSTLLSTEFLRRHSRILAGDDSAYLFELRPDGDSTWGVKNPRNLLDDPRLNMVNRKGGPWTLVGTVKEKDGLVSMRGESSIAQRVSVSAGSPYLLSATAKCSEPNDRAELRLRWFDSDGIAIGTEEESVIPGTEGSEQFLWRRAPEQAASVSAELASKQCSFAEAALFDLS